MVWCGPLHFTFLVRCGICMHQHSTSGIRRRRRRRIRIKKMTIHILTHGTMRECGLTFLVVCINDRIHDIRERNMTIRSEIRTMNIRSLGFEDIRECVTLWGLILQSLGCTSNSYHTQLKTLTRFLCQPSEMYRMNVRKL